MKNTLEALARPYYKAKGSNQWPHILRVVAHAEDISSRAGATLTAVEYAALYFHDAAKGKEALYGCEDHGEASAALAREALRGTFASADLDVICRAIARHNNAKNEDPQSFTEDALRSADANRVELGWVMRKSFNKMKGKMRGIQLLENVLQIAKTRTVASGGRVPPLLAKAYASEIQLIRERADELDLKGVVAELRKAFILYADEDVDA